MSEVSPFDCADVTFTHGRPCRRRARVLKALKGRWRNWTIVDGKLRGQSDNRMIATLCHFHEATFHQDILISTYR